MIFMKIHFKSFLMVLTFLPYFLLSGCDSRGLKYKNPIINKYLADPFIFYESGFYYLFATGRADDGRFIPVYRSPDLVKWEFVRGAVDRGKETDWNYKNFWAPELRKFNNKYYLYYTASPGNTPQNTGNRVGLAISDRIEGPYKNKGIVVPHASIDGHIFEENGNLYIFYTIEHGNHDGLTAGQIYADKMLSPSKVEGRPVPILVHHRWQEGPFILYRNRKYFLTYSCGAWTNETYHLRYAVSDNLLGPYTEHSDTLLKSNALVKGPGHHALFSDLKGRDWIVYHGWDTAFTARYPRIDRLFVSDKLLRSNGPTTTLQVIR